MLYNYALTRTNDHVLLSSERVGGMHVTDLVDPQYYETWRTQWRHWLDSGHSSGQVDSRRRDTGHRQLSASLLSCSSANHDSAFASTVTAAAAASTATM